MKKYLVHITLLGGKELKMILTAKSKDAARADVVQITGGGLIHSVTKLALLLIFVLSTGCSHLGATDKEFCAEEPSNEMCIVVDPLALDEE